MSLLLVVGAVPARAAFPGANRLLVVQPAKGRGLLLVGEDGANLQQICSAGTRCAGARDPVWSPDGSEIAVSVRHRTSVIYADGSCLACSLPEPFDDYGDFSELTFDPGFLPDGRLVVSVPRVEEAALTDPNYDNPQALLQVDSYRCQVNAREPTATAVAQRSSISVYASTGGTPIPDRVTDGCNVDYPDVDLRDWARLYYKQNYRRLQRGESTVGPHQHFPLQPVDPPAVSRYDDSVSISRHSQKREATLTRVPDAAALG